MSRVPGDPNEACPLFITFMPAALLFLGHNSLHDFIVCFITLQVPQKHVLSKGLSFATRAMPGIEDTDQNYGMDGWMDR